MPDLVTHQYFGELLLSSLPESIRGCVQTDLFFHTTPGPDVWFTLGFYGGKNKAKSARGEYMHNHKTGAFLTALADECRAAEARDELFSYLAGFLCHYSLDSTAHPYVYYRTGEYDGSPETLSFRGSHTRLERAIDCYIIRTHYGMSPGRFLRPDRVLPLRKLPDSLLEPLNRVYAEVYGWEDVWDDLNTAITDWRLFYRLMRDPFHLVNGLTRLFDNGKSHLDYRLLSYQNRDLDETKVDFLNRQHNLWRHPQDPSVTSCADFFELMELARQKARQLIEIIYNYVYHKQEYDLPAFLGDHNYSTGLDCPDPRNKRPGVYESLF